MLVEQLNNAISNYNHPQVFDLAAGVGSYLFLLPFDRATIVDPNGARIIYQQLGSKEKKLCWLEKSDHIILLDVERDRVTQEIQDLRK